MNCEFFMNFWNNYYYFWLYFRRCPFCNCKQENSTSLDRHYWKFCPYLTKCPQCSQVLQIPSLNDHFLSKFFPFFNDLLNSHS
jgi:hypothetical protein